MITASQKPQLRPPMSRIEHAPGAAAAKSSTPGIAKSQIGADRPEVGTQSRLTGHGQSNGAVQPPKKIVVDDRRDDEDVHVLGEEEEPEPHPRVLGGEAGHDLRVGLGHVERGAVGLGRGGDEEDQRAPGAA